VKLRGVCFQTQTWSAPAATLSYVFAGTRHHDPSVQQDAQQDAQQDVQWRRRHDGRCVTIGWNGRSQWRCGRVA
jgi:hypothetical protein